MKDGAHEWGEYFESHDEREPETVAGKSRTTDRFYGDESRRFNGNHQKHTAGAFCRRCNAWRGQLGLEPTVDLYVAHIVAVFREVKRVLRSDGTCWVNLGDSYSSGGRKDRDPALVSRTSGVTNRANGLDRPDDPGLKPKDLAMIPARVALALQADGWYLRSDIAWLKRAPMPESVEDRPASAWEHIYLFSKSARYFFDPVAARLAGGTNRAALRSAALTPEANAALDADDGTANFRGRHDASQAQVTILGAMAVETHRLKILKAIRFSVIVKGAERHFVMNLQRDGSSTANATILVALKRLAAGYFPVRATIIDAATAESMIGSADAMNGVPIASASPGTKHANAAGVAQLLTDVVVKELPAMLAFEFDESSSPLLIRNALGSTHSLHDNRNMDDGQSRNMLNYWLLGPSAYPEAHFATFSPEIPRRAIMAGTSERGCCAICGAPWRRVVERVPGEPESYHNSSFTKGKTAVNGNGRQGQGERGTSKTLGWRPTCAQHKGQAGVDAALHPVPCTVLDPFLGSGCTGEVAESLGRHWIGLELSEEYQGLARKRTAQRGLFTSR